MITRAWTRFVSWARFGYPDDVPAPGYEPLFALLDRRRTDTDTFASGDVRSAQSRRGR